MRVERQYLWAMYYACKLVLVHSNSQASRDFLRLLNKSSSLGLVELILKLLWLGNLFLLLEVNRAVLSTE